MKNWMDSIAYNSQSHQLFTSNIGWSPSPTTVNHISYSLAVLIRWTPSSATVNHIWMEYITYNRQSNQLFANNIGWSPLPTTANHISYSPTTLDDLHRLQQPITSAIHQQHWMVSIAYNSQSHQLFTNNIGWTPSPTTTNHISYSPTTLYGLHRLQQLITSAIHQQHWMDSITYNSQLHPLFTNNIGWTPSPATANHISYSPTTLDGLHCLPQPITSVIHQQHWMDSIDVTANHISYSPTTLHGLHRLQQLIASAIHQQHWMDSITYNSQSHKLFTNNIGEVPSPATANHISYSPTTSDGLHRLQQTNTSAIHKQYWMDSIAYNS